MNIDTIVDHYLTCAIWASCLDDDYTTSDVSATAKCEARADIEAFLAACDGLDMSGITAEQLGHDLWLTRCGHGAGFWDRGLGQLGDALTIRAESMGARDCYIVDGRVMVA